MAVKNYGIGLIIKVDAKNAKSELKSTTKEIKELTGANKFLRGNLANAIRGMASLATSLLVITKVVKGIAQAVMSSTTAFVEFNRGIGNLATLLPRQSIRIEELSNSIKSLSSTTGKPLKDLTNGMYEVVSAFEDNIDTEKRLTIVNKGAIAGMSTTKQSLDLLSAVTKAYGDTSAVALERVSDLAFETIRLGQTTYPELASAMQLVTATSERLGVSQDELFATFATFTGVTGDASQVATQLRSALVGLDNPSNQLKRLYGELGVATGKQLVQQMGLGDALKAVAKYAEDTGVPLQDLLGRVEGMSLTTALAGKNADTYTRKLGEIAKASGATEKAFAEMTVGVNETGFMLDKIKTKWDIYKATIGENLTNAFKGAIGFTNKLLDSLNGNINSLETLEHASALIIKTQGDYETVLSKLNDKTKTLTTSEREYYEAKKLTFELIKRENFDRLVTSYDEASEAIKKNSEENKKNEEEVKTTMGLYEQLASAIGISVSDNGEWIGSLQTLSEEYKKLELEGTAEDYAKFEKIIKKGSKALEGQAGVVQSTILDFANMSDSLEALVYKNDDLRVAQAKEREDAERQKKIVTDIANSFINGNYAMADYVRLNGNLKDAVDKQIKSIRAHNELVTEFANGMKTGAYTMQDFIMLDEDLRKAVMAILNPFSSAREQVDALYNSLNTFDKLEIGSKETLNLEELTPILQGISEKYTTIRNTSMEGLTLDKQRAYYLDLIARTTGGTAKDSDLINAYFELSKKNAQKIAGARLEELKVQTSLLNVNNQMEALDAKKEQAIEKLKEQYKDLGEHSAEYIYALAEIYKQFRAQKDAIKENTANRLIDLANETTMLALSDDISKNKFQEQLEVEKITKELTNQGATSEQIDSAVKSINSKYELQRKQLQENVTNRIEQLKYELKLNKATNESAKLEIEKKNEIANTTKELISQGATAKQIATIMALIDAKYNNIAEKNKISLENRLGELKVENSIIGVKDKETILTKQRALEELKINNQLESGTITLEESLLLLEKLNKEHKTSLEELKRQRQSEITDANVMLAIQNSINSATDTQTEYRFELAKIDEEERLALDAMNLKYDELGASAEERAEAEQNILNKYKGQRDELEKSTKVKMEEEVKKTLTLDSKTKGDGGAISEMINAFAQLDELDKKANKSLKDINSEIAESTRLYGANADGTKVLVAKKKVLITQYDAEKKKLQETTKGYGAWVKVVSDGIDKLSPLMNAFKDLADALFETDMKNRQEQLDALEEAFDKEKDLNDEKRDSLQEAYDSDSISYDEYKAKLAEINDEEMRKKKELAEKNKSLQKEEFERTKKFSIAQAIIQGALAIAHALAGPWPLNLINAGIVGVASGVQIAAIANQPAPFAKGGIVTGPTNALIGEAGYHEAVIPLKKEKLQEYGLGSDSGNISYNISGNTFVGVGGVDELIVLMEDRKEILKKRGAI